MLAFVDRAYHVVDLAITGPVEADVDDVGAHSACGEQRPIEDQVGGPGQQRLVLIAGSLALGVPPPRAF
jgi:hypothetical protein